MNGFTADCKGLVYDWHVVMSNCSSREDFMLQFSMSLLHHHNPGQMHVGMLQWSGYGVAARLGSGVLQDWARLLQQG